jgi:hypothetical protein
MVGIFYISDLLVNALGDELNGFGGMNFTLIMQALLSWDSAEQIICLIMLIYLIFLTIVYIIAYFKRFMWISVLIVIAPVVSIMYVFGNHTKQIYSRWLTEYMTTVFIQPFHIVVYYILVSIPLNIANSTGGFSLGGTSLLEIIYALVALAFIRPAEKYIRNLFGIDKGIAGLATYDSGKQTLDQIRKMVQRQREKVANMGKQALTIVGAAVGSYFGGPAGGEIGAEIGNKIGAAEENRIKKQGETADKFSNAIDSRSINSKKNSR